MKRLLTFLILGSLMACQGTTTADQGKSVVKGVAFIRAALNQALAQAGSEQKLVMVDVYSDT